MQKMPGRFVKNNWLDFLLYTKQLLLRAANPRKIFRVVLDFECRFLKMIARDKFEICPTKIT